MTAVFCALIVAAALCWCAWRLTSRPVAIELAHAVTVAAPVTLAGALHVDVDASVRASHKMPTVHVSHAGLEEMVTRWWDEARTPGEAHTMEPVQAEGALDADIEAAVANGVNVLRDAYEKNGINYTETQLEEEARDMVLAEFGT